MEVLLEKQVCGVTTVLSSFKGLTLYNGELGQKIAKSIVNIICN